MLSLAGTAIAVNPDTELRAVARSRGWTVRDFRTGREAAPHGRPPGARPGARAGRAPPPPGAPPRPRSRGWPVRDFRTGRKAARIGVPTVFAAALTGGVVGGAGARRRKRAGPRAGRGRPHHGGRARRAARPPAPASRRSARPRPPAASSAARSRGAASGPDLVSGGVGSTQPGHGTWPRCRAVGRRWRGKHRGGAEGRGPG